MVATLVCAIALLWVHVENGYSFLRVTSNVKNHHLP